MKFLLITYLIVSILVLELSNYPTYLCEWIGSVKQSQTLISTYSRTPSLHLKCEKVGLFFCKQIVYPFIFGLDFFIYISFQDLLVSHKLHKLKRSPSFARSMLSWYDEHFLPKTYHPQVVSYSRRHNAEPQCYSPDFELCSLTWFADSMFWLRRPPENRSSHHQRT